MQNLNVVHSLTHEILRRQVGKLLYLQFIRFITTIKSQKMSIKFETDKGWIISHNIKIETDEGKIFQLNPDLFGIHLPFKKKVPKNLSETSCLVKSLADDLLSQCSAKNGDSQTVLDKPKVVEEGHCNNDLAIKTAKDFYELLKDFEFGKFNGGNNKLFGVEELVKSHQFVFPETCRFFNGDVLEIVQENQFDLVVLDPPWWNKFIRRKRKQSTFSGYTLLDTMMIEKIPIEKMTTQDAIVAVWCTNSSAIQKKLVDEIFPKWNIHYVTTWYWLKVTTGGIPICPFDNDNKKQPYEAIIIGCRKMTGKADTKIIVSVPSSIHSHKPPLFDVLKAEFKVSSHCEIFARYLYPKVTSFGNEVIKLQHSSLFV